MLQRIYTRVSKPAARYTDRGSAAEHCSACRFFMSGGDCARVLGRVLPQGWCKYFSREAVQRWNPLWPMQGSTVPTGATLDLDFLNEAPLDPRITFTRASTATYFDANGVMQTAAVNVPRFDNNPATSAALGLLIEDQRTNLLLNSATLGTQGVVVTAQAYTLSFYGTGTITKSGAATGVLTGTGAFPQRVSQTFTPTAGTLTCTVTGSVLNAQLEAGGFSTSWIPTTGATVTRAEDQCGIPPAQMGFYVSPYGSWSAEFTPSNPAPGGTSRIIAAPSSTGGAAPMYENASSDLAQYDAVVAFLSTANAMTVGAVTKGASAISGTRATLCLNAGVVAAQTGAMTGYPGLATAGVAFMTPNVPNSENCPGYIRRVRYWPRALSDAEMQQVTT